MTESHLLYPALLFAGGAANLAMVAAVWRRRAVRGAGPLLWLLVAGAVWSCGYGAEILAPTLAGKALALRLEYPGIVGLSLAWLLFAAEYTGRDRALSRLVRGVLWIVPASIVALAATHGIHHLLWTEVRVAESGPFSALVVGRGPAYWVNVAYSYALFGWGTLLLLRGVGRARRLYRRQSVLLLASVLVPWATNAVYVIAPSVVGAVDLTPFAFTLSAIGLGWGLLRFRLLDLAPIAREAVLEGIGEGVFVLDERGRVVDVNAEAERIAGRPVQEILDRHVTEVLGEHPALAGEGAGEAGTRAELGLSRGSEKRHYAVRAWPLWDRRGRLLARVLTLADVSARVEAEQALQHTNRRIEALHGAALRIAQARDEEEILRLTVRAAERILAFSMCGLYLLENGSLVVKAVSSGLPPGVIGDVALDAAGLAGRTHRTGETTVFSRREEVPELLPTERPVRSGISAAIGRLGVFQVASDREGAFAAADGRLLELLLGHTEEAIHRLRLGAELREQAIRDALTGVYNRRYLQEAIREWAAGPVALLMVDIDRLKELNDRFGHAAGDRVLQGIGEILQKTVREGDFVVRYGGDEFLVVLPRIEEAVEQVADRVREALSAWAREHPIGGLLITASVGVAQWTQEREGSWERVLEEADRRMYAMKGGRAERAHPA